MVRIYLAQLGLEIDPRWGGETTGGGGEVGGEGVGPVVGWKESWDTN